MHNNREASGQDQPGMEKRVTTVDLSQVDFEKMQERAQGDNAPFSDTVLDASVDMGTQVVVETEPAEEEAFQS